MLWQKTCNKTTDVFFLWFFWFLQLKCSPGAESRSGEPPSVPFGPSSSTCSMCWCGVTTALCHFANTSQSNLCKWTMEEAQPRSRPKLKLLKHPQGGHRDFGPSFLRADLFAHVLIAQADNGYLQSLCIPERLFYFGNINMKHGFQRKIH